MCHRLPDITQDALWLTLIQQDCRKGTTTCPDGISIAQQQKKQVNDVRLCLGDTNEWSWLLYSPPYYWWSIIMAARYLNASLCQVCIIYELHEEHQTGVFWERVQGYKVRLATASPVRQVLYWLRRRLKLIEKETEITESLQLKLCSYSPISMVMHSAQRKYYSVATQQVYLRLKRSSYIFKCNFWNFVAQLHNGAQ